MKAFLVFLALIWPIVASEDLGACSMCTMVVDLLETQNNVLGSKEEWMKQLLSIADKVCANVPETIASPTQCKSYIELNAPYIVDLITSDTEPSNICKTIGVCDEPVDSTAYKLIYPIINEHQVSYLVEEKEITKDTEFNYKLFLGNPQMLSNDYELAIEVHSITGCDVLLKVTNKTTFVEATSCNQEKNCTMQISEPGKGLWYYVTVHAKLTADSASFSFNATEKNETSGDLIYAKYRHKFHPERFTLILCFTFSLVCLLCLCISRCMFTKRARRYNHIQEQPYTHLMMQPLPETVIPMQFGSQEFDPDGTPVIIMYAPYPSQV